MTDRTAGQEKSKEPRTGVFICSCGGELAKALDLASVEADCRKLPGVVYAGVEPYPCSRPGLEGVGEVIEANRLNRAVIAGCTPRLHGRLFADACEKAGMNRWLVEFADIRERCARVHGDRFAATKKARDLVRGAVANVSRSKPLESIKVTPVNSVLVIGGGISGLTAAATLARSGHEVVLVEKSAKLGGNLARVPNVYPFASSGSDIVGKAIAAIKDKVEVRTGTTLSSLSGFPGRYAVTLCPARAAEAVGDGPKTGAERTDAGDGCAERSFGAIVVATGSQWLGVKDLLRALQKSDPEAPPEQGDYLRPAREFYGKLPIFTGRVLTHAELESEPGAGTLRPVRKVLFLNVLPRIRPLTRLDSLVALKNAVVLRHSSPETEVTVVFDRIPAEYERDSVRARSHGVKFVRAEVRTEGVDEGAEPLDFTLKGVRVKAALAEEKPAEALELEADLIVIPALTVATLDSLTLAKFLRIPTDVNGLMLEPHVKLRAGDFAERAIFVVGACHGPSTVFECLTQADDAAARAAAFLKNDVVRAPLVSNIDRKVCRGCSRCAKACEWDAIEMVGLENGLKLAVVDETMCTGCGVCAMVCICGAPTMAPVERRQVGAAVAAMLSGG